MNTGDTSLPTDGDDSWLSFPARLGVEPVEAPGDHEAMLTEPARLAKALLTAAGHDIARVTPA
ncbi:hypothetical protein AB0I35_15480 [Nocardia sp. NPDC050378]|uniref:hypothetical protein n=1 Tax=Nocardia sp. NPDC050378 TaxID=3155400 RepID=UPI0033F06F39